jgi:hypothetical protein
LSGYGINCFGFGILKSISKKTPGQMDTAALIILLVYLRKIVFKDLQKLVVHSQQENTRKELFQRLQDKPFWIWDVQEHKQEDIRTNGDCFFNHIIGLPQKDGIDKPLYDYEEIIFDYLVTQTGNDNYSSSSGNKHLWIKKATGLGVSEFMLRFMAWLCLKDDSLAGSQMCIVTGPRIDLAIALIEMKYIQVQT